MEILLAIVSALIGIVTTHYYYKRQTKEQVNLIPYIREVNTSLLELHGMTMERQDAELQRGVKTLVMSMLFSRHRVINSIVPSMMLLKMVDELLKSENEDQRKAQLAELNELAPIIKNTIGKLSEAGHEYDGLQETAEEISGKKFLDMFTTEEVRELFKNPKMFKRSPKSES